MAEGGRRTRTAALAGLAAGLGLIAGAAAAQVPDNVARETRNVPGLQAAGEILVDRWGVPHIYAGSIRDAFFLQGYNAARDRLWQIDLWRKRGLGLLARDFGPAYVDQDRAARLFLYRGDMTAEWAAYGPQARGQAEAFVAGINAFVGEIRRGARAAPVEFTIAGSTPDLWSPEDVVRIRSHGLSRNVASEVVRAQVACKAGIQADHMRRRLEPAWTPTIPQGLDPCAVPANVLDVYTLGTKAVSFAPTAPGKLAALDRPSADLDGSNAWVVSGARTDTGRPVLASDPHRAMGAPSLRYIAHLEAPGLSVIGAGEPALPGVSIGHNDKVAFGLTIFAADQEDLYAYELKPGAPDSYRYGDSWETLRVINETIPVKGEADRSVSLRFTRHGPVLWQDGERAYALKTVWDEPGAAAYFGSSRYMTASNGAAFRAAVARWKTPSENLIYADADGDIGWIVVGAAPRRANWDGLMPVPGDGRFEWGPLLTPAELPSAINPATGWFATANEMNLPEGYPFTELKPGFEWAEGSRARRIKRVLADNAKVTVGDSMSLQFDHSSDMAMRLKTLLAPLTSDDPLTAEALALLRAWNGELDRDSGPAALFEVWSGRHLGRAVISEMTPEPARALVGSGTGVLDAVTHWLESTSTDPASLARRDRLLLLSSLKAGMEDTIGLLGADRQTWRWGRLHRADFQHPLAPLADEAMQAQMRAGPEFPGGGATTPGMAAYNADFAMYHGASFKMVVDVGAWDNSMAINAPGQSGEPASPHYRDLMPTWAKGGYFPMLFSRAAVERETTRVIQLMPGDVP